MTNRFDIEERLKQCYNSHFDVEESKRRPVIGITANYGDNTAKLASGYYEQVVLAGGTPLIIPPISEHSELHSFLDRIDGLLLSGGADYNPLLCGEEPIPSLGGINSKRDLPELLLCRLAANRQMPILGICRGIQTMALALGGKVAQDIEACGIQNGAKIKHSQDADRSEPTHTVSVDPQSQLYKIFKELYSFAPLDDDPKTLAVNSFHHQAVSDAGEHFRVSARAKDGVIEAIESCEKKPFVGVQWHPECMGEDGAPLFIWLVEEAKNYRMAQLVHDDIVSLDTHCDTPMFFPQGVNFLDRDPRILVDRYKMTEGRLDGTIMVAYVPQPVDNQTFADVAPFEVSGPKAYADLIFDKIEDIVADSYDSVALARTPDELLRNKFAKRKSIMLGIENGLALEGELKNLDHFAERGVVYITLCHNGDNDICDSAKKSKQTWGGVSPFGEQVIRRMNELGIMVDLSHASEKSFYDALRISSKPIVCSHSSSRALCDHPRNLTDDQMRALAEAGGVCQITLYNGFLRTDGQATIDDAMAHLMHAIDVMGIDHVGLGTDFDGDGGVLGLADASELTLFTRQLLEKKFSLEDIQKIWGGNFQRVMRQWQEK